jgi:hypothetical protein
VLVRGHILLLLLTAAVAAAAAHVAALAWCPKSEKSCQRADDLPSLQPNTLAAVAQHVWCRMQDHVNVCKASPEHGEQAIA